MYHYRIREIDLKFSKESHTKWYYGSLAIERFPLSRAARLINVQVTREKVLVS